MGLEIEKQDTSLIMDEEEFNRSIEPILSGKHALYSDAARARDPQDINAHLQVVFEDVIAEPRSSHSFDRVWILSHAGFELIKFVFYRVLSTLLAVPIAFILGLLFAIISLIHIWLVMPFIHSFLMILPSLKIIWRSWMEMFVSPLFTSAGRILSSVRLTSVED